MNLLSILLIAVIAALFILALRHSLKHAGDCSDCDGTKCETCSALNSYYEDLKKRAWAEEDSSPHPQDGPGA